MASQGDDRAPPAIVINDLAFDFPGRDAFGLEVRRLEIEAGQSVFLFGPSGSGKSTLLNLICGVLTAQQGELRVLGTELGRLSGSARDGFRAERIGIIFQMFNLLPYLSIRDNVLLPLSFAPERAARAGAGGPVEAEARRILDRLELDGAAILDRPAARLSVGQQQRVAAARALIGNPPLVIADEPTSALDRDRQQHFLDLLFEETRSAGSTLLMVSHDHTLADRFDRRIDLAGIARVRHRGEASDP